MRRSILLGAMAPVFLLSACGSEGDTYAEPAFEQMEASADIMVTGARRAEAPMAAQAKMASPAPAPSDGTIDAPERFLAYEYDATLMLPTKAIGAVQSRHEAACTAAGIAKCQVISSYVNDDGGDYANGRLEIRAAKDWLATFRDGLNAEAEAAEGRLSSISARADDLTRAITDTSARLEAQRTLRERLLVLLERDTDDVGDLLQIERELARVQGEIESAESYLRVLTARVSMDRMNLNYQTLPQVVSPRTTQPLIRAFLEFFNVLSESLARLILFIAGALPWLVIGLPLLWLLLRFANRFRRKR